MKDILDLKGRVALVTGAGQGVGRQAALHLASHNAGGVIVNDFFRERAEEVAAEIRSAGGKAIGVQCDVTKLDQVKAMVAAGAKEFGSVDILVNNAGNAGAEPTENARKNFWETTPEDWNSFIGVNFYGVINCTSAVVPGMVDRRQGRIVTVISDAGRWGDAGLEIYAGAKAGAAGFMRACARGLGRYNIAANCVAIAMTMTPPIRARMEKDPERLKKIMQNYVVRRPGEPEDVANMILFLASDASSWVTGQTYPVNGGFTFGL
jgi:2-hydroxycyclohexanecarboxyl-CoA dehydrogenase